MQTYGSKLVAVLSKSVRLPPEDRVEGGGGPLPVFVLLREAAKPRTEHGRHTLLRYHRTSSYVSRSDAAALRVAVSFLAVAGHLLSSPTLSQLEPFEA